MHDINAMVYGLCLERLRHQLRLAEGRTPGTNGLIALESYCTGSIDEIVEHLELYDLSPRTREALDAKLDDLAETASVLLRRPIRFAWSEGGELLLCTTAQVPAIVQADSEQRPYNVWTTNSTGDTYEG